MTDEQQKGLNDPQEISAAKDEAEKSFLKELDEEEKSQPQVASSPYQSSQKGAPKAEKSKSMFASALDSLSSKPQRKRDIDPILGVSLAVFILCSVIVLGNFAYGEITKNNDDAVVKIGDTVEVEYVGCYGDYYGSTKVDGQSPVVFDTNMESVNKQLKSADDGERSWAYQFKESFSALSFVVGGTSVLTEFGNATIGHKVGDEVKVTIQPEDAYKSKGSEVVSTPTSGTVSKVMRMTTMQFTKLTGHSAPSVNCPLYFDANDDNQKIYCPFGWSYSAHIDSVDTSTVIVENNVANGTYYPYGQKYTVDAQGETTKNGVSFAATVTDSTITYTVVVKCDDEVSSKSIRIPMLHNGVWISVYQAVNDDYVANKCVTDEKLDMTLYFTIKITKIKTA